MRKALKYYLNDWEDELNKPLMTKSADDSLVEYVIDAWKSLEEVTQLEFQKFEYEEDETKIDINKHIFKREKKKKKKDRYDIKFIDDNRCGNLTVYFTITMEETDPTTGETTIQKYPIKKSMLIPIQDDDGFFMLKGKKYFILYQLLEKSTYTSNSSVTLKSLMPIAVKRNVIEKADINGTLHVLPFYTVYVFRKEIPIIYFYLSKGYHYALSYLNVDNCINILEKLPDNPSNENLYFMISKKCYIEVDREIFYKYQFVQSVIGGLCKVCTNRTTLAQLEDEKQWIKQLVVPNNYEKGLGILKYFNRMLDQTTRKKLKVPEYYRNDIYALLRWMMQHFNELRLKDNCDLG